MAFRSLKFFACITIAGLCGCTKPAPPPTGAAPKKPATVAAKPKLPQPDEANALTNTTSAKPNAQAIAAPDTPVAPDQEAVDGAKPTTETTVASVGSESPAPLVEAPPGQTKRMVLYTPSGPVVVEYVLRIDGQGATEVNEAFIDELLKAADTNADDEVTWSEALASQRTGIPQFIGQTGNAQEFYDRNRDGKVDRSELWNLLGHGENGLAFRLEHYDGPGGTTTAADVARLIDEDADGAVSLEEIDAAPAKLRLADVDDDERLSPADLGAPAMGMPQPAMSTGYTGNVATTATILDGETDWSVVQYELDQRYLMHGEFRDEALELFPDMAGKLDADENGFLSTAEAEILNYLTPHLRIELDFGSAARLTVADMRSEVSSAEQRIDDRSARLDWPNLTLAFSIADPNAQADPAEQVKELFDQADQDKNGYIEESEAPEGQEDRFKSYDANADGKVYPDEVEAALKAERTPLLNRLRAVVTPGEHSLLAALDTNRDGSLSLREINEAPKRLRECDRNGDGRVTLDEIPTRISVHFERGAGTDAPTPVAYSADYAPTERGDVPNWFRRMDHNEDGDISPREFLGGPEKFSMLDKDGDGLLSLEEATAEGK